MRIYIYSAFAFISLSILLLCLEVLICIKNDCFDKEKARFGSLAWTLKIAIIILITVGIVLSGYHASYNAEPDYFSIAFPLVDRNHSDYLSDIEFVQPKNSDLYEAIGYSWYEDLFVTIAKDTHEVRFFPDTDYEWYLNIAESPDNIDGFIGGWAAGLISPNDQYTPF